MAALALNALSMGAEKIPDKAFHAVPGGYFRPKEEKKKLEKKAKMHDRGDRSESRSSRDDRRERHRERRKSDDYSASGSGSDTEDNTRRRKPQRPSRRNRRYTSSQNLERGYDSDGTAMARDQYQQSRGIPPPSQPGEGGQYFPPPPMHAYEDGPEYRQETIPPGVDPVFDGQSHFPPQGGPQYPKQTPNRFGSPRDDSAASNERYQSYSPRAQAQTWEPKRNSFNPGYTPHAGYANNYATGYQQPSQQYYPPQAGPNQAPYNMPPPQSDPSMNGAYPTYVPPQDTWTASRSPSRDRYHSRRRSRSRGGRSSYDDDRSRSRSRSRSRDQSRHRGRDSDRQSKSRNRSRSMAAQAKETLKSNRDVASSALGIVAGGLIGNQVGRGNKFGTLAGAVLGGFGANLWEKKHADKKEGQDKRHSSRHDQDVVRYRPHESSHHGRHYYDDHYGYESD